MKNHILFCGEWGQAWEWLEEKEMGHLRQVFAKRFDGEVVECSYFEYRKFLDIVDLFRYHEIEAADFGKTAFEYYDNALAQIKQHYIYVLYAYVVHDKNFAFPKMTKCGKRKGEKYWIFREVEVKESEVYL